MTLEHDHDAHEHDAHAHDAHEHDDHEGHDHSGHDHVDYPTAVAMYRADKDEYFRAPNLPKVAGSDSNPEEMRSLLPPVVRERLLGGSELHPGFRGRQERLLARKPGGGEPPSAQRRK